MGGTHKIAGRLGTRMSSNRLSSAVGQGVDEPLAVPDISGRHFDGIDSTVFRAMRWNSLQ
jgi:hypothetical protein